MPMYYKLCIRVSYISDLIAREQRTKKRACKYKGEFWLPNWPSKKAKVCRKCAAGSGGMRWQLFPPVLFCLYTHTHTDLTYTSVCVVYEKRVKGREK
jgi:hypothetical protein